MHWFDRISRQVAAPERTAGGSTRRGLLKSAAMASVAVPLVGVGSGAAAPRVTQGNVSPDGVIGECENCLARVNNAGREKIEACSTRGTRALAGPKRGKGGGKKKMKPSEAARRTACQAKARQKLAENLKSCGYFWCEAPETPAVPTAEGKTQCPPGTGKCTDQMCCAGDDLCCPCGLAPEGMICCVSAIGCSCC
ncbi:MAG: hypothetical protein JST53_08910 [Actinobacteria bacterium]|nr:hypothetical protein [Actinomycetota bacterium]